MNWRVISIVIITFFIESFKFTAHPMHISVCDIRYNQSAKTLEISQKIFIDDLELALEKNGISPNKILDSITPHIHYSIKEYLGRFLQISIDHKVFEMFYVGAEIEEDAVWCYVEIQGVNDFEQIEITNSVLLDVYDDQRNIINLKIKSKSATLLFTQQKKKGIFLAN